MVFSTLRGIRRLAQVSVPSALLVRRASCLLAAACLASTAICTVPGFGSPSLAASGSILKASKGFAKKVRQVLDSIDSETAQTLIYMIRDARKDIDTKALEAQPKLEQKTKEIEAIMKRGPIDLSLTYEKLYELVKAIANSSVVGAGAAAWGAQMQILKTLLEQFDENADPAAIEALADEIKVMADQVATTKAGLDGIIASGKLSGGASSMSSKLAALAAQVASLGGPAFTAPLLGALSQQLQAYRQRIESSQPPMDDEELSVLAKAVDSLFQTAGAQMAHFSSFLDSAALLLSAGDLAAVDALLQQVQSEIDAAAAAKQGADATIAATGPLLQAYEGGIQRLKEYRKIEKEIIDLHKPICSQVNFYNDLRNPDTFLQQLGADYIDFAVAATKLKSDFQAADKQLGKETIAAAKAAAKKVTNANLGPPIGQYTDRCGLLVTPLKPNDPNAPPNLPQFPTGGSGPPTNPFPGNPFPQPNDFPIDRSPPTVNLPKLAATDRTTKALVKAKKQFMRFPKQRIADAYRAVYKRELP